MNRRLLPLLAGLLTALAVAVATLPSANRELSLDDIPHLQQFPAENAALGLTEVIQLRHWQNQSADAIWRPVPKILWWSLHRLGLNRPVILSLATTILSGCCATAFALWLARTGAPFWLLLLATLMPFANPASQDVLLPFVGQSDLLAAAGVLAAAALMTSHSRSIIRLVFSGLLLLLSFLSKESAWPAVAAIPVLVLLGPGARRQRRRDAAVMAFLGMCLFALILLTRWTLLGSAATATGGAGTITAPGERPIGILELLGRHAAAILAPRIPQTDYSFLKQPGTTAAAYPLLGATTIILVAVFLHLFLRPAHPSRANAASLRVRRQAAAALIWAVLFALPYIGLLPLGAVWAGRFLFLSLFGWTMLLACACLLLPTRTRWIIPAYLFVIVAAGLFALAVRGEDWRTPQNLWTAETQRVPGHAFAWKNRAVYEQRAGNLAAAHDSILKATDLWPAFADAWLARAQIAWSANQTAEAAEAFDRAASLTPENIPVLLARAKFNAAQKRFEDARQQLLIILKLDPANTNARQTLDHVLRDLNRKPAQL